MPSSVALVTVVGLEVLSQDSATSDARVTSAIMEVLSQATAASDARVTSVALEVLSRDGAVSTSDVLYVVIVGGRVTEILFGPLPTSTDTILYIDLSGYSSTRAIGDYFSEICGTFDAAAPVIPPGEIAPPYPPGTTPPVTPPGGGGTTPTNPGPTPLAVLMQGYLPFHANGAAVFTATNFPATPAELTTRVRTHFDFTDVCAVRLQGRVASALASAQVIVMYSTDGGTTWDPLSAAGYGPHVPLDAIGDIRGPRVNVVAGAQQEVLLTLFGQYGDDGTDVDLGNLGLMVYAKTGPGSCTTIDETPTAPYSTIRVTSVLMEVLARL